MSVTVVFAWVDFKTNIVRNEAAFLYALLTQLRNVLDQILDEF